MITNIVFVWLQVKLALQISPAPFG